MHICRRREAYIRKKLPSDLPGIPMAPTVNYSNAIKSKSVQGWYQKKKADLARRLPFISSYDLAMKRMGFASKAVYKLEGEEHLVASRELKKIIEMNQFLEFQPDVVDSIVDALTSEGFKLDFESEALNRKELAEKFLKSRELWELARHFLLTSLEVARDGTDRARDVDLRERLLRIQAEVHCLLAYIGKDDILRDENAFGVTVDHLMQCRILSRCKDWRISPGVVTLTVESPGSCQGMTIKFGKGKSIDGNSVNLSSLATLMEFELIISLLDKSPPPEFDLALDMAKRALQLASDVSHPAALSSALLRLARILQSNGNFRESLDTLQRLRAHCEQEGDLETLGIALQEIGQSFYSQGQILKALEFFVKQLQVSEEGSTTRENALNEIGSILLAEGQPEAEYCYKFERCGEENVSWAMAGLTSGMTRFSRVVRLARNCRGRLQSGILQEFHCISPLKLIPQAVDTLGELPPSNIITDSSESDEYSRIFQRKMKKKRPKTTETTTFAEDSLKTEVEDPSTTLSVTDNTSISTTIWERALKALERETRGSMSRASLARSGSYQFPLIEEEDGEPEELAPCSDSPIGSDILADEEEEFKSDAKILKELKEVRRLTLGLIEKIRRRKSDPKGMEVSEKPQFKLKPFLVGAQAIMFINSLAKQAKIEIDLADLMQIE